MFKAIYQILEMTIMGLFKFLTFGLFKGTPFEIMVFIFLIMVAAIGIYAAMTK